MARRKSHLLDLCHIPCRHDHTTRVRIILNHVHDIGKLVDGASVGSRPAAPLMSIHRTEISVLIRPLIPDGHTVVLQILDVGVTCYEPQKFMDNGFEVHFFSCQQREAFA